MNDPLGDNLKSALGSLDRILEKIKSLHSVGHGHLAYFGPSRSWNHLRYKAEDQSYLCGEPYDKLAPFVPVSAGGAWCPDCLRRFRQGRGKAVTL